MDLLANHVEYANARRAETRAGIGLEPYRRGAHRENQQELAIPVFAQAPFRCKRSYAVNTVNVLRGQCIRRALLTVARTCFDRGVPLPTIPHISKAVGICDEQARRHMRHLIDEGAVSTRMAGKRRYVREIQS